MRQFNDDLFGTPLLKDRLDSECEMCGWTPLVYWACAQRTNGIFVHFQRGYSAEIGEKAVAENIISEATRALNHDGAWVAQWLAEGRRLNMIWLDADGDPQFTVELDEDAAGVAEVALLHWLQQLEEAWGCWRHLMREVLDPSPDELFKRAQGEQNPASKLIH